MQLLRGNLEQRKPKTHSSWKVYITSLHGLLYRMYKSFKNAEISGATTDELVNELKRRGVLPIDFEAAIAPNRAKTSDFSPEWIGKLRKFTLRFRKAKEIEMFDEIKNTHKNSPLSPKIYIILGVKLMCWEDNRL